ncbi:Coenzyme A disulfide reductase [Posidoniimonas polymericola]|uniref:Coenzyme A disulfide reductase n=1 Tax=Posidoniimonas polymericola TaxID=2528002 RepID=A0A5C5YUN2_9BACT|nr:FAD-dependent oxidoreductase [Posidoniimonas polymericola]TWT78476.1 Coenzyme A disulfide reductase [Posidoniimonas polymericola]
MSASSTDPVKKIVIVGGVAGGASAAARARRLSEASEIVVLERGNDPSFANCGMPYYVGGQIATRDKLLVSPIERLQQRYRLDVRVRQSVEKIDREKKQVEVRDLTTGKVYTESYDKLILAPGAAPLRPPLPGIDLPGIYTLRNLDDADRLLAAAHGAKQAVIIGGGFIGLEMAENLVHRGIKTTVVERNTQILTPWDAEMAAPVAEHLKSKGVELILGDSAESFAESGGGLVVRLGSGADLPADMVVLSIGVKPENQLAVDAGLEVGPRGGIKVAPTMQTTDPDIYAVGDAVETTDAITGEPTQIPLAGPANRQGRIAADHIFGRDSTYRGTQGTAVVGVFDMTAAMTGLSEKACERLAIPCEKVYIHPAHHAGYYPGAQGMTLKLLFSPRDGRVLGAQAIGGDGVDKRIDVIAMAIQGKMTVYDLEEAELCYAPQYGSAKDPVNMAGFAAAGVLRGDQPVLHCHAADNCLVLDVRTPGEHAAGAIDGAVNIPLEELRERHGELPKDQKILAYCKVGQRGYMATRLLNQLGYETANLSGGMTTHEHRQQAVGSLPVSAP